MSWDENRDSGGDAMNDPPTPVHQIEGVALSQDKAEHMATNIPEADRADVGLLRAEMAGIRDTAIGIQGELALLANKRDVEKARTDLLARIASVEKWLQVGFGVLAGLLAGLIIAALRYLPAVGHS
jgi:hypothetical protein